MSDYVFYVIPVNPTRQVERDGITHTESINKPIRLMDEPQHKLVSWITDNFDPAENERYTVYMKPDSLPIVKAFSDFFSRKFSQTFDKERHPYAVLYRLMRDYGELKVMYNYTPEGESEASDD